MNSMTGFGRATFEIAGSAYRIELRTLNSRFLEVKTRLPWSDPEIDGRAVSLLRQRLARGRVDLAAWEGSAGTGAAAATHLQLNGNVARQLREVLRELSQLLNCDVATSARLLGPIPGMLTSPASTLDTQQLWEGLEPGLERAIDALLDMRREEGAALRADLVCNLDRVRQLADRIAAAATDEPRRLEQRLTARLARLAAGSVDLDDARVAQEAALLADRADISEEISRLRSHESQLRTMLDESQPVGRKIEFMLQEINRELNTVAAKTANADMGSVVVEAKSCLEKMREQAQNVE